MITRYCCFAMFCRFIGSLARNCSGAAKHHRKAYETSIAPKKNCRNCSRFTKEVTRCRTRCSVCH